MATERLSDQEFLVAKYKKLGGLLLGELYDNPDSLGRDDAHYLRIGAIELSDYFTYSHRDLRYAAQEEAGRKAAIRVGEAVISMVVQDGPAAHILRPASLTSQGIFPQMLARQGIDMEEQGFIMADAGGPVGDPQGHSIIPYLDNLPDPAPQNIPDF